MSSLPPGGPGALALLPPGAPLPSLGPTLPRFLVSLDLCPQFVLGLPPQPPPTAQGTFPAQPGPATFPVLCSVAAGPAGWCHLCLLVPLLTSVPVGSCLEALILPPLSRRRFSALVTKYFRARPFPQEMCAHVVMVGVQAHTFLALTQVPLGLWLGLVQRRWPRRLGHWVTTSHLLDPLVVVTF